MDRSVLHNDSNDAPGRDVEIVCGGDLGELIVGEMFFGAIRKPSEPYYVPCGVIRINTTRTSDGFMAGDFWIKSFTEFEAGSSIIPEFAEVDKLHLGYVPSGRVLRIGDSLQLTTDIDDLAGLQGQIVINGRDYPTNIDRWSALTRVRNTTGDYVTLQDANSPDNTYTAHASELGGGAIGVVSFHLHREDCLPPGGTEASPAQFTQTGFNNGGGIVLTEYGRLTLVGGTDPVLILRETTPVTTLFDPIVDGRQIKIRPRSVGYPAQRLPVAVGKYSITPTTALRCADTFEEINPPAVAPFTYVVCVVRDCDHDGNPDPGDPSCATATCAGTPGQDCIADCDGGDPLHPGVPDGGVTIDDLLYYLGLFESGSIDADIDDGSQTATRDGGVTIDHLLFFIQHFDAGC